MEGSRDVTTSPVLTDQAFFKPGNAQKEPGNLPDVDFIPMDGQGAAAGPSRPDVLPGARREVLLERVLLRAPDCGYVFASADNSLGVCSVNRLEQSMAEHGQEAFLSSLCRSYGTNGTVITTLETWLGNFVLTPGEAVVHYPVYGGPEEARAALPVVFSPLQDYGDRIALCAMGSAKHAWVDVLDQKLVQSDTPGPPKWFELQDPDTCREFNAAIRKTQGLAPVLPLNPEVAPVLPPNPEVAPAPAPASAPEAQTAPVPVAAPAGSPAARFGAPRMQTLLLRAVLGLGGVVAGLVRAEADVIRLAS
ncbi:hypothetical protein HYH03_015947 [Edaphochlamys debaryana]|uniref:Uncharacterized protein n=1 Tax=Edaphochlamys debaryana TaxID=47281 RepID=A0A835XL59_9CHLO|nr:hypothetical protein HYH03_015947 [Edaphochlamys debaryana]|eukprot:KAG2485272.1 hypothetical protein HYH03_015947 [Edaphochlamys debaryana]